MQRWTGWHPGCGAQPDAGVLAVWGGRLRRFLADGWSRRRVASRSGPRWALWLAAAGLVAVAAALLAPAPALADTKTWTGLSGTDSNWLSGNNWNGGNPPSSGDDLVFPGGAPRADTSFNNFFPGTSFNSITFSGSGAGYTINGNRITLAGGITSSSSGAHSDTLNLNLSLSADQTFAVTNGGVTLELGGVIFGAGIKVTKSGPGLLRYTGSTANGYDGTTTVTAGTLELGKTSGTAILGPLVVGDGTATSTVLLLADNQLSAITDVTVSRGSILNLFGSSDTIGSLSLESGVSTGASVITGAGTLKLGGDVTLNLVGTGLTGGASAATWTWAS
jgi:autotransporter-associated beta strand protein